MGAEIIDGKAFAAGVRADVAAHLVNLAWNGLAGMERRPRLHTASRGDS